MHAYTRIHSNSSSHTHTHLAFRRGEGVVCEAAEPVVRLVYSAGRVARADAELGRRLGLRRLDAGMQRPHLASHTTVVTHKSSRVIHGHVDM
jgi:hypothetical protein